MQIPVLMYHAVQPEPSLFSITPELFSWQMEWLHTHNCRVISLGDLVTSLINGKSSIPERTIVLTFDDGFESLYDYAFPTLTKYGFPATVFLVTGYCGNRNSWPSQPKGIPALRLLSWEQIEEMDHKDIEFGAHTVHHPPLDRLTPEDAEREISESKGDIENKLGHAVHVFAYPYGRYNHSVKEIVSRVYNGACSTHIGYANRNSDPYAVERIDVNYYKPKILFRQLFSTISKPYLTARRFAHNGVGKLSNREWY